MSEESTRHALLPEPSDEDLEAVRRVLRRIGGPDVVWGANQSLEVLLSAQRLRAEQLASDRVAKGTWVLSIATVVLALATVALIFATLAD